MGEANFYYFTCLNYVAVASINYFEHDFHHFQRSSALVQILQLYSLSCEDNRNVVDVPHLYPASSLFHVSSDVDFIRVYQSREERRRGKSCGDHVESTEGVERPLRRTHERSLQRVG